MSVWTNPEAMDLLRARAEAGDSSGQIVAALAAQGFVVSRNAVIGKLLRAGIPLKGAATRAKARHCEEAMAVARPSAKVAPVAAPRVGSGSLASATGWPVPRGKVMPFPSPAAVPLTAAPEGGPRPPLRPRLGEVAAATLSPTPEAPAPAGPVGGVPLIGLPSNRWPVAGDGAGLLVCGGPATRRAYCAAHGQLAYQPLGTPLRLPADPTVRPVRSRERERSFMDAYGEAV